MDISVLEKQPVVSVIIPVYNVEQYLETCVDSIRRQTLRDIEIILVDDGSPDNCPEMCDAFAREDSRIKVIHKRNAGPGYARNSGIELATGRWLCFVDSDDYIALNTLSVSVEIGERTNADQVRYLSENFAFDADTILRAIEISDDAIVLDNYPDKVFPMLGEMVSLPTYMITTVNAVGSVWGGIYRRDVLLKNRVQFPSGRDPIGEDHIFNLEFAAVSGSIAYTQNVFYFYRNNPMSLTSFSRDRIDRSVVYCKYIEKRMLELGYPQSKLIAHSYMLGFLRTHFLHIFSSNMPTAEKRQLHREAISHAYLDEIASDGEYRKLPFLQRLAFKCRKSYSISKYLVNVREALRHLSK